MKKEPYYIRLHEIFCKMEKPNKAKGCIISSCLKKFFFLYKIKTFDSYDAFYFIINKYFLFTRLFICVYNKYKYAHNNIILSYC